MVLTTVTLLDVAMLVSSEELQCASRKHAYIFLSHQTPLLYSKTEVYRGKQLFFLFLLKNIDCGYSLEPPCGGGSNEYPQSMFCAICKISDFLSENFHFLVVKFSVYLDRLVFVTENT